MRHDHYIMRNAPDLLGMDEFSFESLMHLDKLDITFIPDKQIIHAGRLTILHGHELGMSVFSPVNIARGLFLRAKDSALCGHHHQASEHSEPNINGKLTTCWSVACLCELHPAYIPINKPKLVIGTKEPAKVSKSTLNYSHFLTILKILSVRNAFNTFSFSLPAGINAST